MRNLIAKISISLMFLSMSASAICRADSPQSTAAMQSMSVAELEKAGDECRAQKDYEQAIKYFNEGLRKERKNAKLYNKRGLAELKRNQVKEARSDFLKAAKYDAKYPEALNNIGVAYYLDKQYGDAAKYFKKAVALDEMRASFHVNLGVAWFAQDEIDRAIREYTRALELDPEILQRESRVGVAAQITSSEQRAKHEYMMAKIYARMGDVENCFACLRRAKENGYGNLDRVYKDEEFASIRQDARLAEIVPPPK